MGEPLQVFQRTLKLPCDGLESGQPFKARLDASIQSALSSLSAHPSRPRCEFQDHAGHLSGTLMTDSFQIQLHTSFGQNSTFQNTVRQTFISYQIRLECRVPALELAEHAAENLTLGLKIAGGILGPVVFFGIVAAVLKMYGAVYIPWLWVALSLFAGVWCGSMLGGWLGARLETGALRHAESKGTISNVDGLWDVLVEKLEQETREYQQV